MVTWKYFDSPFQKKMRKILKNMTIFVLPVWYLILIFIKKTEKQKKILKSLFFCNFHLCYRSNWDTIYKTILLGHLLIVMFCGTPWRFQPYAGWIIYLSLSANKFELFPSIPTSTEIRILLNYASNVKEL